MDSENEDYDTEQNTILRSPRQTNPSNKSFQIEYTPININDNILQPEQLSKNPKKIHPKTVFRILVKCIQMIAFVFTMHWDLFNKVDSWENYKLFITQLMIVTYFTLDSALKLKKYLMYKTVDRPDVTSNLVDLPRTLISPSEIYDMELRLRSIEYLKNLKQDIIFGFSYLVVFHFYTYIRYKTCENNMVGLYLTFYKYYFLILKYLFWIIVVKIAYSRFLSKRALQLMLILTYSIVLFMYIMRFRSSMNQACFRL
jgi:Protein of unknown function (DUF229)